MKKSIFAALVLMGVAFSASAQTAPQVIPITGGQGNSALAASTAVGGAGGAGGVGIGKGGDALATGGLAKSGTGDIDFRGGDTHVERGAPSIAFVAPAAPQRSCKDWFGFAGSNTSGSFAFGIPIGKDNECMVESAQSVMSKTPYLWQKADHLYVQCKHDTLFNAPTCKAYRKSVAAQRGYTGNDETVINRTAKD